MRYMQFNELQNQKVQDEMAKELYKSLRKS